MVRGVQSSRGWGSERIGRIQRCSEPARAGYSVQVCEVPVGGRRGTEYGAGDGWLTVTIVGSNFGTSPGATTISFGSGQASNVLCSPTQCTAMTPAGTSIVDVIVSVSGLPSARAAADQFSYILVVTGVSRNTGPRTGGTSVNIAGAGLTSALTGTVLTFGANVASAQCTANACTAQSPAGIGIVDVQVTVDGHTSAKTRQTGSRTAMRVRRRAGRNGNCK